MAASQRWLSLKRRRWAGSLMGNNLHISLSSKFTGFCCSTSALAVPKVPSRSKTPLFPALTGSTFFSTFAAFVLCLSDVSDRVQSAAVLTAFLHQSASFGFFFSKKHASSLPYLRAARGLCGFIAVIMHSAPVSTRHVADLRWSECFQ